MSNNKSSAAIDDEKKSVINLHNALVNDSKSIATNKIIKTLIKKQETNYIKKTLLL